MDVFYYRHESIAKPRGKRRKPLERNTSGLLPPWWKMVGMKWVSLRESESIDKPRWIHWKPLLPFWHYFILIWNQNGIKILIPRNVFWFKYNLTHIICLCFHSMYVWYRFHGWWSDGVSGTYDIFQWYTNEVHRSRQQDRRPGRLYVGLAHIAQ